MECATVSFIFTISIWSVIKASPVTYESVEWKFSRRLYDYKKYGSITLERVELPPHTQMVNLSLNAFKNDGRCTNKKVHIYANQFGIPVVSRQKEGFPKYTYTPSTVPNITITTTNKTYSWILSDLFPGNLFVMALMPNEDARIRQKGLYVECGYFVSFRATFLYYAEGSIPLLTNKETKRYMVAKQSSQLIGFKVLADTSSYELKIEGCRTTSCLIKISLWQTLRPEMWATSQTICTLTNGSCLIQQISPHTETFNYVGLTVLSKNNESISFTLLLNSCTQNKNLLESQPRVNDGKDICVLPLNRETPANANDGSNFQDRFVVWDANFTRPLKMISVKVPDNSVSVVRFKLRSSDTGASLNIQLQKPGRDKKKEDVEITVCTSLSRIVLVNECPNAAIVKIDSQSKKKKSSVMVPYPQTGIWYISIQSRCFQEGKNGSSSNATVKCQTVPVANLTVGLTPCVNGGCGQWGVCKLYTSADILYSACDCFSGWRGYGCNDGSKADSQISQKVAVYLLTLSNLAFIPGIGLALYRRYFVEAFVYTFNMFFSTFYHACDSSNVYKLCILTYEALSFADFFSSLMSFAVTLLAMARIPINLRSFLHIVAAMFVAVGEVYNRHGLFEQLIPIASGVVIVIISWGYEIYKTKSLFPSKRRYLMFIVPGLTMAVLGLTLNLAVETDANYKYVHSTWHLLVSLAIVFLLPPRRGKINSTELPLSIQSGDVMSSSQGLFINENHHSGFQNAGEPDSIPSSESTSLNNRGMMLTNRNGQRQSYVL